MAIVNPPYHHQQQHQKQQSTSTGTTTTDSNVPPKNIVGNATIVLPAEESVVDSACGSAGAPAPELLSTISLSSASPASADLLATDVEAAVPPAVPVNSLHGSPVSTASFNADLLSCFAPLGRLWPYSLFSWSTQKKLQSDSDAENYEIPIDSIDVQWDTNYIGGGNQSSVFRGRYQGQWIALKKLNRASEVDIRRMCSLDHRNVIRTIGMCTRENFPCIVMEYCEQGSLFDYLRRTPDISKFQFIDFAEQLAEGMAYLHSLKIVHRDLKSPNVLIANQDTLKICDFGSLYTWEHRINSNNPQGMASVPMSVCGTAQWMSPEMLRSKPCNERVDVWSYAVVVWELLSSEVPYDKLSSAAVVYQVGSGRLLHVPKSVPSSVSLLFTMCWAHEARNRPSFKTILKQLGNVRVELSAAPFVSKEAWAYRRQQWKREIRDHNSRLHDNSMDLIGEKQDEQELVKKRMHELRHAQEIRQMYDDKLARLNRIHTKICCITEQLNKKELFTKRTERTLQSRLAHDAHWHSTLHEWHAALQDLQKTLTQQAERETSAEINNAELQHLALSAEAAKEAAIHKHSERKQQSKSSAGGRPALLRKTFYDYDEEGRPVGVRQQVFTQQQVADNPFGQRRQLPARKLRRDAISSPMATGTAASSCTSTSSDDEEEERRRQKALRKQQLRGSPKTQLKRSCPSDQPSSLAHSSSTDFKPIKRDDSAISSSMTMPFSPSDRSLQSTLSATNNNSTANICVNCCQIQPQLQTQFFARNSVARASGLSADSGVCPEEECNGNCWCQLTQEGDGTTHAREWWSAESTRVPQASPLPKEFRARTRSARTRSQQQQQQQSAFMRNSPMRTPSRASRRQRTRPASRARLEQQPAMDSIGLESLGCSSSSVCNTTNIVNVNSANSTSSAATLVEKNEAQPRQWISTPELCQQVEAMDLEGSEEEEEEDETMPDHKNVKLCPISEMTDSQVTERAVAALESLSSTMVSSLERSLEMAAAHSDGLSDKEAKLKEVQTTFKLTHRRTSSNPTNSSRTLPKLEDQKSSAKCQGPCSTTTTEEDESAHI